MKSGMLAVALSFLVSFSEKEMSARIEDSIYHVAYDGIAGKIPPFRNHPIIRNKKKRTILARSIARASRKYHEIPPMLLVATAYRENSFGAEKVGKRGEKGVFQILPKIAASIRGGNFPWSNISEPGCQLSTVPGSALCAAALLSINKERCGNLQGAVSLYVSGHGCRPGRNRVGWIVHDRLWIANYLSRKFFDED